MGGRCAAAANPPNRPNNTGVDLGNIPPDISATVSPNIVLSFDNSGSMASQYIPDANSNTSVLRFYSSSWNLEYYDPNKTYLPGLKPDGSAMLDATYTAAWVDGICANRPSGGPSKCALGTEGPEYKNNGSGPFTGRCYTYTTTSGKTKTTHYNCDFFPYDNVSSTTDKRGYDYTWIGSSVPTVNLSNDFGATFGIPSSSPYTDVGGGGTAPQTGESLFRAMGNTTLNGVSGTIGGFYATNKGTPAGTCLT